MENVEKRENQENQGDGFAEAMQDAPEFGEYGAETLAKKAEEYRECEQKFAKMEQNMAAYREKALELPEEERAEQLVKIADYRRSRLRSLERELGLAWYGMEEAERFKRFNNEEERYRAEGLGRGVGLAPEKTIEAATGELYDERASKLREAMDVQGVSPDTEDFQGMRQTWEKVRHYFEDYYFVDDRSMNREESREYDRARQVAHNHMIEQLNLLNALADKYGTERFTVRDFRPNYGTGVTGATGERLQYDRYTVVEYFKRAFRDNVAELEQIHQRRQRLREFL